MDEYKIRLDKVLRLMNEKGADGLLVTQKISLYYLTGRIFDGWLYISSAGETLSFKKREALAPDGSVRIRKPEEIPARLSEAGIRLPGTVMLETVYLTYPEYVRYAKVFEPCSVLPDVIRQARMTKTEHEIERIRECGRKHSEVYDMIPGVFSPGMTDIGFQIKIEQLLRENGNLGMERIYGSSMEANLGSVLAGPNAACPSPYDFALGGAGHDSLPMGANGTVIAPGMCVMVDMCGNFNGYMTDLSRVYSCGEVSALAGELHETSERMTEWTVKNAVAGASCRELYLGAADIAKQRGHYEYFMASVQENSFIAHGVGLELNEGPVIAAGSRAVLEKNTVLALEPKFAAGFGAVGNEDTYVVTDSGLEPLTLSAREIRPLGKGI